MRVGSSPNKKAKAPREKVVSLGVVTHFTWDDYHRERLVVVALSLETMRAGCPNAELIIWDNGSTAEFRQFLRGFSPDILIESRNVGIDTARKHICSIASGEFINLADDDILYHPQWYAKQKQILDVYPNVALVSGSAINYEFHRDVTPNWDFAHEPEVQSWIGNNLIPAQWERDFSLSIGKRSQESARVFTELLLEYKGVKAWGHGHHMQLLSRRSCIQPFIKSSDRLMPDSDLAERISAAGLLQLTTYERTAVHIGNVIDESILRIAKEWGIVVRCP